MSDKKHKRKIRQGTVVSTKMDKTIAVESEYVRQHPLYKKRLRRHKNLKAHDENETATAGDLVRIEETRPTGADKCWRLLEVVEEKPELKAAVDRDYEATEGEADDSV